MRLNSLTGEHFSGSRVIWALSHHWWWDGMHRDVIQQVRQCAECALVSRGESVTHPPLHPIAVQRTFQIVAVDILDFPITSRGNKHVLVFQVYLTKWPMVRGPHKSW